MRDKTEKLRKELRAS